MMEVYNTPRLTIEIITSTNTKRSDMSCEPRSKRRKLDFDAVTIQKVFEERVVMKTDYQPLTHVYQAYLSVKTRYGSYYDMSRLEDVIRLIFKDRPCIMLLTKPRSDFVSVGVMYFSDPNPVMCEYFERVEELRKQVKPDGVTIRFSRKPVFNAESYLKFVLKRVPGTKIINKHCRLSDEDDQKEFDKIISNVLLQ
ncbi:unnamed protein product [Clavelina lepadiformis]|uniref:Uncharacterized protein n=1 Tax=Clavelina lepadiformis TaxID=159417 RepID=A0ABP0GDC1_CLALP